MTNDDQRPDHAYRRIKAIVESGAAPPLRDRDDWVSGNLHLVMQARKKKRALNPICESHAAPVLEALSIYETRGSRSLSGVSSSASASSHAWLCSPGIRPSASASR